MAPPKPSSSAGGKPRGPPQGKPTGATGTRLWEKKPFQGGGKPGGSNNFKPRDGGAPGAKKAYQSNFKKRKAEGDAELTPDAKKVRKQLTAEQIKERKALKPNASLISEVLRIWGIFSQKSTPREEKHKLISELLKLAEGKIVDIVFRGSASRVFQSVLKEGNAEHRAKVFAELKNEVVAMAKNAYAHRLLMRLLHHATTEQTDVLIPKFYGHVCNLMRQRDASRVIEYIYSTEEIGRPLQKLALVEEFYGVEFETIKPKSKRTVEDIIAAHPEKKATIVAHLRSKLMPIINKADMSTLLNHTIVHLPLLKLFELSSIAENQEMIEALKDNLVRIVHSREGAKVVCHCLGHSLPKARKAIVKSMKSYVLKIAMEQHGHVVLLRVFDVMDDTVFVSKTIISELKPHLLELSQDRFGRVVLLHLIAPTSKRYLTAETLELLQPAFLPEYLFEKRKETAGDEDEDEEGGKPKKISIAPPPANSKMVPTSKKDPAIRQTELYNAIIADLRTMALAQTFRMMSHIYARDVFFETIITSTAVVDEDEKTKLLGCVLRLVGEPKSNKKGDDSDEEDEVSKKFHALDFLREKPLPEEDIMTHSLVHRMLRRFVDEEPGFDALLFKKLGDKIWDYTTKTYSSWVVFSLLRSESVGSKVAAVLKPHKAEIDGLAKEELNKAAQAIKLYLEDPAASKEAQHEPAAPKPVLDEAKKQQLKKDRKEKEKLKKVKSVPLVDDEEKENNDNDEEENTGAKTESAMDVDQAQSSEAKDEKEEKAKTPKKATTSKPTTPASNKKSPATKRK